MAISIEVSKCQFDSHTVTISSPVEPDGGDHYCVITFGDPALWYLVTVKLDGVTQHGSCGMYFTSAGESYVLELKHNGAAPPTIKWTYEVSAIYAPGWATLKGKITLNLDKCCYTPSGSQTVNPNWRPAQGCIGLYYYRESVPASAGCYAASGSCEGTIAEYPFPQVASWTFNLSAMTGSDADVLASEISSEQTLSQSVSAGGSSGSMTMAVHIDKAPGTYIITVTESVLSAQHSGGTICNTDANVSVTAGPKDVWFPVKGCKAIGYRAYTHISHVPQLPGVYGGASDYTPLASHTILWKST